MQTGFAILSGELGLIGLFDLGQLLLLNRATGMLDVTHDGRRGRLAFRNGHAINALDEAREQGLEAAYRVFQWKQGRFEFRAGEPELAAVIEDSTEAVMLEAARRIDEAAAASGADARIERTRLVQHQAQFDALRDEFARVTRDAGTEPHPVSNGILRLDALRNPADTWVFRGDSAPRLRRATGWEPEDSRDAPLDRAAYEAIRCELLGSDEVPGDTTVHRRIRIGHAGYDVSCIPGPVESLWIRLAGPAVDVDRSGIAAIDAVLAEPGLALFVAAPRAEVAHASWIAAATEIAARRRETVLLAGTDLEAGPPASDGGLVLTTAPHTVAGIAAAVRPLALGVDLDCPLDHSFVRALANVPWLIAATVSARPEAAVSRWLMRFPAHEAERVRGLLETLPVAVLFDDGTESGHGRRTMTLFRVKRDGHPRGAAASSS